MTQILDAFKAFMTAITTIIALNTDNPLKTLAVIGVLLTIGGLMWLSMEDLIRQKMRHYKL